MSTYKIYENKTLINTIVADESFCKQYCAKHGYTYEFLSNPKIAEYQAEIDELKQALADSDYKAIKYAEGEISEEDYAPIKAQRQAWRNRINELEALISG